MEKTKTKKGVVGPPHRRFQKHLPTTFTNSKSTSSIAVCNDSNNLFIYFFRIQRSTPNKKGNHTNKLTSQHPHTPKQSSHAPSPKRHHPVRDLSGRRSSWKGRHGAGGLVILWRVLCLVFFFSFLVAGYKNMKNKQKTRRKKRPRRCDKRSWMSSNLERFAKRRDVWRVVSGFGERRWGRRTFFWGTSVSFDVMRFLVVVSVDVCVWYLRSAISLRLLMRRFRVVGSE